MGRDEGREKQRAVLLQQLVQRFGEIPDPMQQRIEEADVDDLMRWAKRVIPAQTLADVFDDE